MNAWSAAIQRRWYGRPGWLWLLWPLTRLFDAVAARRRRVQPWRAPVPVIVVGNIAVGGTGKTPVVAALVDALRQQGYRPGVVSRGYGGRVDRPTAVAFDSDPAQVGDEPVLLAQLCDCPVWVCPDRPAAVRALLAASECDVVIADDGLQHYALGRDLEVAVIDGQRGLGNGQLLPVGPLRETPQRLGSVDWVLINGGDWACEGGVRFQLRPVEWVEVLKGRAVPLADGPTGTVHAVAGIGHPQRFFDSLRQLGLEPVEHAFGDHHAYRAEDLDFAVPPQSPSAANQPNAPRPPIVTTAKDAVKLRPLLTRPGRAQPELWYLAVRAELPESFLEALIERLGRTSGHP